MSKLRSINTSIWSDTWFELLSPEEKLLFIYFVTNEKTNMLGVYEISVRKVSFETSITEENIEKYLIKFDKEGKIRYYQNRVVLLNFLKHQNYNFNMMKSAIRTYNDLPSCFKTLETKVLPESKEGFKTLCNGFGRVRKIEVEYEVEYEVEKEDEDETKPNDIDIEDYDKETFKDIEQHKEYYLKNLRLRNAFCNANKIKNEDLPKRLNEFHKSLEAKGRFKETFNEYASYFLNWHKKTPITKTNSEGRMVANFSNPVI